MTKDQKIEETIKLLDETTGNYIADEKRISEAKGILKGILNTKDEDHD